MTSKTVNKVSPKLALGPCRWRWIARLMKAMGLRAVIRGKPIRTTHQDKPFFVH